MVGRVRLDNTLLKCDKGNFNQVTARSQNQILVIVMRDMCTATVLAASQYLPKLMIQLIKQVVRGYRDPSVFYHCFTYFSLLLNGQLVCVELYLCVGVTGFYFIPARFACSIFCNCLKTSAFNGLILTAV